MDSIGDAQCFSGKISITPSEGFSVKTLCYGLKLKVLSNKTTLVLSNTRELDRVPKTK